MSQLRCYCSGTKRVHDILLAKSLNKVKRLTYEVYILLVYIGTLVTTMN